MSDILEALVGGLPAALIAFGVAVALALTDWRRR